MLQQGIWSHEEHDRFLEAIKLHPQGPWRVIAKIVGSRSVRQVQTHAQKYHEKVQRRMKGSHKRRKTVVRTEHRIDAAVSFCRPERTVRGAMAMAVATATPPLSAMLESKKEIDHSSFSFEALLKQASDQGCASPTSPFGANINRNPLFATDAAAVKLEAHESAFSGLSSHDAMDLHHHQSLVKLESSEYTAGLPTFSESLDFLIEYYSD